jgi:hypothetical protein
VADNKKKAFQRFGELTRLATAPGAPAETDPAGEESPPVEELTIQLHPRVSRALKQRAAISHSTPSELVEAALRRYLDLSR